MSAFHRIPDVTALDGPTFFRLAWRLSAYTGVMQARVTAASDNERPAAQGDSYGAARGSQVNPGTKTSLQVDPAFQGVFSFG